MLHPKNPHQGRYDLEKLCAIEPKLSNFVINTIEAQKSIDFSNPKAVLLLNTALLKDNYSLEYWSIPEGHLCPPIPSRADYIHHISELVDTKAKVHCLDIGVGANCIYPIIGSHAYNWNFIGSDISKYSLANAQSIIDRNHRLASKIELRLQTEPKRIFKNIIKKEEYFDLSICNPPFYPSAMVAQKMNQRKTKNLGIGKGLNFSGQDHELWCAGGELKYIKSMIQESHQYSEQVNWFTSLVSLKENLRPLKVALKKQGVSLIKVIPMTHGNKQTRILCWKY